MSGIPTQQGTSYGGSYSNWGYHASDRGIINVNPPFNALDELRKRCSHSAAFDSSQRYDAPRCAESTRLAIIGNIEEWIQRDEDNTTSPSVFWLYGGAGVGKSALAQSISEKFQQKKQLAASFFFFRGDRSRNDGNLLIPTLASHLVDSFKDIIPFVEHSIRDDPALFTKNYRFQIQELLVKPLLALKSTRTFITHPRLIVIDGLDECMDPDIQVELLRVIARAILKIPYSFRFFITSRPEAHITRVFNHDRDLQAIKVHSYNLSDDRDGDVDIRKFLETGFAEIRRSHPVGQHLPYSWPDDGAITSLVNRSSGHFIYASTVIRFIQSPEHRPDERLEAILHLRRDEPILNVSLSAAVAVMDHLVETKGEIEALFRDIGINPNSVAFAAGFDEQVFASGGVLIQQAYISTRLDFAVDGERITCLLDSLGKKLSPYSGVVSTPSRTYYPPVYLPSGRCSYDEFNSFPAKPSGISEASFIMENIPAKGSTGAGDGRKSDDQKPKGDKHDSGSQEKEGQNPSSASAPGGGNGDPDNLQSMETNDVESSLMPSSNLAVAPDFPPNDDPPNMLQAGNVTHFEVGFNIRHSEDKMCTPNQTIRIQGTIQSEEIPEDSLPYPMPHAIFRSRIRFLCLDFYCNAGNTGYIQSCAVIKINVGENKGKFTLFDVTPQSISKQDAKMKLVETHEKTKQHQIDLSTSFAFLSLKPTIGGKYGHTTGNKSGIAEETSVNTNRITHTRTGRDMSWTYCVDDEWMQENGLCGLTPSASFSFYGAESCRKPEKLNIEITSTWTTRDAGLWDIYTRFTTIPLRNIATRVSFDIPPHMTKSWAVFRDLGIAIVPRSKGIGVQLQMEGNYIHGDIKMEEFEAGIMMSE